ncbi:hypothetical protein D3C76_1234430 [compost metagenome]
MLIVDIEFRLERHALFTITRSDGFAQLKRRVGRRQHRRRMGADDVQMSLGEAGDVVAMIDDGVVQMTVFKVGVADIDGGQNHFVLPRTCRFHQQHRGWTGSQQFPVFRREQGLFQGVIGEMLLDHQPAAFSLLHIDDGFMLAVIPGLLGGNAVTIFKQGGFEHAQHAAVIMLGVADQQVQMRLGHAGNQFGPLERQAFRVLGFDDHQDAANGLHDRDLLKLKNARRCTTIVAARHSGT